MWESLSLVDRDARLFYFTLSDDFALDLERLGLSGVTVVRSSQFVKEDLEQARLNRTPQEFFFTCTPYIISHVLSECNVDHCIYVDSDMYFYSAPTELLREMSYRGVLLTDHWYSPEYDYSAQSGKYCVQFMPFFAGGESQRVLEEWKNDCLDWCYLRAEDGKWGDQGYLQRWEKRYSEVCITKNFGAGVAPWNTRNYRLLCGEPRPRIRRISTGEDREVIFFHFQNLEFFEDQTHDLGFYRIDRSFVKAFYGPYVQRLVEMERHLRLSLGEGNYLKRLPVSARLEERSVRGYLRQVRLKLRSRKDPAVGSR